MRRLAHALSAGVVAFVPSLFSRYPFIHARVSCIQKRTGASMVYTIACMVDIKVFCTVGNEPNTSDDVAVLHEQRRVRVWKKSTSFDFRGIYVHSPMKLFI